MLRWLIPYISAPGVFSLRDIVNTVLRLSENKPYRRALGKDKVLKAERSYHLVYCPNGFSLFFFGTRLIENSAVALYLVLQTFTPRQSQVASLIFEPT